jgi:hypothetical protein
MKQLLICVCLFYSMLQAEESGWTVHMDFNDGEEGQRVKGMDAAGQSKYTKEQSYEGGQGLVMRARRGKEEFGHWGGIIKFPKHLHKGDELWWRVHTYWPKGINYSAAPRLKFLRIHTCPKEGGNFGYDDIYINPPGSKVPLQFIYEGAHKWTQIGTQQDAIQPDTWECYEYYLKLDDKSVADGGEARVRMWKNGKLIADISDRITLKKPDGYADGAFLFTYWNSSPWIGQMACDNAKAFTKGELVFSDKNPDKKYKVAYTDNNAIYIEDPEPNWKQRKRPYSSIKVGETLKGVGSGSTSSITAIFHSHPVMDVKMYVDNVTLTTQKPDNKDAAGNPYLGATKPDPVEKKE